jgi:APA family basic amino acid/polyamine antiporter
VNRLHPKFRTPYITQILLGVAVAIPAGFLNVREAASLVSIGTLLAFVIVCAAVMLLRRREPNLPRPFKTPLVWFVAPAGILSCLYLMYYLPLRTWMRLVIWLAIGLMVYFGYGIRKSKLAQA